MLKKVSCSHQADSKAATKRAQSKVTTVDRNQALPTHWAENLASLKTWQRAETSDRKKVNCSHLAGWNATKSAHGSKKNWGCSKATKRADLKVTRMDQN